MNHTTLRRHFRLLFAMVLLGCVLGSVVAWLEFGTLFKPGFVWWAPGFFGVLNTVAIWSSILAMRRLLLRYVPLRSWWQVLIHTVVLLCTAVVIFLMIEGIDGHLCEWLHLGQPDQVDAMFGPALVIVILATVVIGTLTYAFDFYRQLRDAQQSILTAELRALRAQINPHFLFNTLNSIAALIRSRPAEAEGVTEKLADLFRYTLRASDHPTVTLAEDLDATQFYIDIEQARFPERLHVSVEVPAELRAAQVPSLLLQPLVENAVKHGVAKTEGPCAVLVRAERTGDTLCLQVRDTGPGFASTDLDTVLCNGCGLTNVRDRLQLLFGKGNTHLLLLPDGVELHFPYAPAEQRLSRSASLVAAS